MDAEPIAEEQSTTVWYDMLGSTCSWYAENDACESDIIVASRVDAAGFGATEMCCECMEPTSPHFLDRKCASDYNKWHDSGGYSCLDYTARDWCSNGTIGSNWDTGSWGDFQRFANSTGVSAEETCCDCTDPSSADHFLTDRCAEDERTDVFHWLDKHQLSCEVYISLDWCEEGTTGLGWDRTWGALLDLADSNNFIATDTCCGCMDPTSATFLSHCNNDLTASVWRDQDGLTCGDYESLQLCKGK